MALIKSLFLILLKYQKEMNMARILSNELKTQTWSKLSFFLKIFPFKSRVYRAIISVRKISEENPGKMKKLLIDIELGPPSRGQFSTFNDTTFFEMTQIQILTGGGS